MSLRADAGSDRSATTESGIFAGIGHPLFAEVADRIWDDIRIGNPAAGQRLPSERALSTRYGVSRVTLRAALSELRTRGVIRSSSTRGWFVVGVESPTDPPVRGLAEYAASLGLRATTEVVTQEVRPCTVAEAEALRVAPGSALFDLKRLRFLDGLVVAFEHNRLPAAVCDGIEEVDFNHASLYATLREARPPQIPKVASYSVEARSPTEQDRTLLDVSAHTPMLVATQLAFNQDGRPMELAVVTYRGDRYRFQATITG